MKKTIIFDFDGTIANTFTVVETIAHDIAKRYQNHMTTEEARAIGLKQALKKSKLPIWQIPQLLIEVKYKISLRIGKDINIFPDMDIVLHDLAKEYDLAIISSNSFVNIERFLNRFKLRELFSYIHSDSSLFGKHIVLQRFCRSNHVSLDNVVYIGDEDRDIIAAKRLKIKMIAVTWGYNNRGLLQKEGPDYLIDFPLQILEAVKS